MGAQATASRIASNGAQIFSLYYSHRGNHPLDNASHA